MESLAIANERVRSPLMIVRALHDARRRRQVKLPWAELETEAARQGCSAADIFFDWSGREVGAPVRIESDGGRSPRHRPSRSAELRRSRGPEPAATARLTDPIG